MPDTGTEGLFQYRRDGFTLQLKNGKKSIAWQEIERLEAYKKDLFTIDEVCLNIVVGNTVITISEETEGFGFFVNKLNEIFPVIEKGWDLKINQPPFATNFTVLYQRND